MKKRLIALALLALAFGAGGVLTTATFAEEETKTEEKKEIIIHPEGEEDALSGKIEEIDPSAPPILIQISPVSNQVRLEAGVAKEYSMTVKNAGSSDFSYHVYATPYSVSDEDYNISFANETSRTQISRWIKFYQGTDLVEKASFKIKSGETQLIKYRVDVPEDIPAGGQYATIFAETDVLEDKDENAGSGIHTASRVGLIIYGRTNGETIESGEITDFNIPGFLVGGNVNATSKVKNSGNTDFEVAYSFSVKSILDKDLYSKNISYNVLPDTERRVNLEWDQTPFMGIFKVNYKVSVPGLDPEEKQKIVIVFPIIMIILTILVLTGLIIGVIMLIRKRRERRARLAV